MYKCLHDYVTATIKLQNHCDRADILDIESYLAIRMNTSGVYPTMSLYLFTFPSDPPTWFFSHELVKEAFLQINRIVSTYNDIVSAHQEIKSGHVDNIIPLLIYQKGLTAQEAVDEAIEIIKVSYVTFLSLETKLTSLGQERGITREVEDFLQACINLCMGALQWTYHIKRYFNYKPGKGDGAITVILGHSSQASPGTETGCISRFRSLFDDIGQVVAQRLQHICSSLVYNS
ncbi:hypothetical protein ASPWEDRAFT_691717 [Aspergillus wentii DTO 134E9]|uniref:Terpene synthase n=1 Tax=Aspergillus wentii DTO 134E9 TaxID=1073089 RepID=A0A1L9R925_ASPWE|nr:uncharacterized protein ASPWEDRAFT_691717 [Aspergillus wentii DTO 134E9]OJJ31422.1 hypothetical protein ASPWEDRAFT_691717 [Aspergillus wentii DTO 134E9]